MRSRGTGSSTSRRRGSAHRARRWGYSRPVPRPTPLRWSLLLALLGLCACTTPGDPSTSSPGPTKADATKASATKTASDPASRDGKGTDPATTRPSVDAPRAWTDPPRTHLLLLRHEGTSPDVDVLPLRLSTDPPAPLATQRVPALPRADWAGHFLAVAAHGGAEGWVHAGGREGAWTLVQRGASTEGVTREVAVGATIPAAMHMVGDAVFVGAGNTVGTVDLAAKDPRWQVLHERPDMQFKAYDLFARAGEWLVAIDDEVMPMYADAFTLDASGRATHRAAWSLPGVINGHYDAAVLGRRGTGFDGTLWVVAGYGIMDGHGQDLAALAIEDHALRFGPEVTLNSQPLEAPPVLEEHVSRQTGKPEKLAFGSDYTPWTGLARWAPVEGPAKLLLAAGSRGLLVLPEQFGPSTRAEAIDVGGECADVLVDGGRVRVLVGGPAPALLELSPTATSLEPGPRLSLPQAYHRFVR